MILSLYHRWSLAFNGCSSPLFLSSPAWPCLMYLSQIDSLGGDHEISLATTPSLSPYRVHVCRVPTLREWCAKATGKAVRCAAGWLPGECQMIALLYCASLPLYGCNRADHHCNGRHPPSAMLKVKVSESFSLGC